jgi:hypothetical protein
MVVSVQIDATENKVNHLNKKILIWSLVAYKIATIVATMNINMNVTYMSIFNWLDAWTVWAKLVALDLAGEIVEGAYL